MAEVKQRHLDILRDLGHSDRRIAQAIADAESRWKRHAEEMAEALDQLVHGDRDAEAFDYGAALLAAHARMTGDPNGQG